MAIFNREAGLRKNFRKKILSVADSHPHRQLEFCKKEDPTRAKEISHQFFRK